MPLAGFIMSSFESSIIIPAHNKWDLTRICLKSLAATTDRERVEVLALDNASSDVTPKVCEGLGKQLFGDAFRYLRNEQNRNFAGASNQGALLARGEYLIFLNNDTEVLPGWYEPLLDDFCRFPRLAATGPILLYPPHELFGSTVQHLGVLVSPAFRVGHLYAGISADSPLAKKRRFFQIISAACMCMPKNLFMQAGMFDELFVNGFEDVDLCARLSSMGYRMTVNPASHVIHYESQTQGRHDNETANSARLREKTRPLLRPEWQEHLHADGLYLKITDFLLLTNVMQPLLSRQIDPLAASISPEELKNLLIQYPFWEQGWLSLAEKTPKYKDQLEIWKKIIGLYKNPDHLLKFISLARENNDHANIVAGLANLATFIAPAEKYLNIAQTSLDWCKKIGMGDLVGQYEAWLKNFNEFQIKNDNLNQIYGKLKKQLGRK